MRGAFRTPILLLTLSLLVGCRHAPSNVDSWTIERQKRTIHLEQDFSGTLSQLAALVCEQVRVQWGVLMIDGWDKPIDVLKGDYDAFELFVVLANKCKLKSYVVHDVLILADPQKHFTCGPATIGPHCATSVVLASSKEETISCCFEQTPLDDVLAFLRSLAHANIIVTRPIPASPITLYSRGVSVLEIMEILAISSNGRLDITPDPNRNDCFAIRPGKFR